MTHPPQHDGYRSNISINPALRNGEPCIRDLRITVRDILTYLAAGMSPTQIVTDFPDLTDDDILTALKFAVDNLPAGFESVDNTNHLT